MLLFFTAVDRTSQFRDFSCYFSKLEDALDFLSSIASSGDTLIKVNITDDNQCTELPSQVFDGECFSTPMQQLEEQWQAILAKPHRSQLVNDQMLIDLTRQRITQFNAKIQSCIATVQGFEMLIQRLEEYHGTIRSKRGKSVDYYKQMIARYQQFIREAEQGKELAMSRLLQLEYVE